MVVKDKFTESPEVTCTVMMSTSSCSRTHVTANVLSLSSEDLESLNSNEDNQVTSATTRRSLNNDVCVELDASSLTASLKPAVSDVVSTDFSISTLLKTNDANQHHRTVLSPSTKSSADVSDRSDLHDEFSRRSIIHCDRSDFVSGQEQGDPLTKFYRAAALYYGCYVQLYRQHHLQNFSPSETGASSFHHDTTVENEDEIQAEILGKKLAEQVYMFRTKSLKTYSNQPS
jgi:hypothetical protein